VQAVANSRPEKEDDSGKSYEDADPSLKFKSFVAWEDDLDESGVEGDGGYEKRREPAWDVLFGPDHRSVAYAEHENADDRESAKFLSGWPHLQSEDCAEGKYERGRDQITCAGEHERWECLDAKAHCEKGASPKEIDTTE